MILHEFLFFCRLLGLFMFPPVYIVISCCVHLLVFLFDPAPGRLGVGKMGAATMLEWSLFPATAVACDVIMGVQFLPYIISFCRYRSSWSFILGALSCRHAFSPALWVRSVGVLQDCDCHVAMHFFITYKNVCANDKGFYLGYVYKYSP